MQEESKTSDPDETISLSPENQRAGVKPSGKAQFLSIKAQSESNRGGLGSFSDDKDNDNDNENDTADAGYGKDNDKVESRGTEVVASFNDRKPGSPGSAIASGREMKVLGGEISGSAIAQIANKRYQQVASGESQQEEQEEEEEGKANLDSSVLTKSSVVSSFVVTDGDGRVDSGNHSGVSESEGESAVSSGGGGKVMEVGREESPTSAGNVGDATQSVKEDNTAPPEKTESKVEEEMDAVVAAASKAVAPTSPSLEKWDSVDIIGDLVDQVEIVRFSLGLWQKHIV